MVKSYSVVPSPHPPARERRHVQQQGRIIRRRGLDSLILVATLWLATFGIGLAYPTYVEPDGRISGEPGRGVAAGIDPNTAEWFEFAQLPGIGETVARRFAAFRQEREAAFHDRSRVFEVPSDLAQVSGIGAITVKRIRPFLRWPDGQTKR